MTWLKNIAIKVERKTFKRTHAGIMLAGYYNGKCPVCDTHIGTDIYKDKITQQFYSFCGNCKREIYPLLDQSKVQKYADV